MCDSIVDLGLHSNCDVWKSLQHSSYIVAVKKVEVGAHILAVI